MLDDAASNFCFRCSNLKCLEIKIFDELVQIDLYLKVLFVFRESLCVFETYSKNSIHEYKISIAYQNRLKLNLCMKQTGVKSDLNKN